MVPELMILKPVGVKVFESAEEIDEGHRVMEEGLV